MDVPPINYINQPLVIGSINKSKNENENHKNKNCQICSDNKDIKFDIKGEYLQGVFNIHLKCLSKLLLKDNLVDQTMEQLKDDPVQTKITDYFTPKTNSASQITDDNSIEIMKETDQLIDEFMKKRLINHNDVRYHPNILSTYENTRLLRTRRDRRLRPRKDKYNINKLKHIGDSYSTHTNANINTNTKKRFFSNFDFDYNTIKISDNTTYTSAPIFNGFDTNSEPNEPDEYDEYDDMPPLIPCYESNIEEHIEKLSLSAQEEGRVSSLVPNDDEWEFIEIKIESVD